MVARRVGELPVLVQAAEPEAVEAVRIARAVDARRLCAAAAAVRSRAGRIDRAVGGRDVLVVERGEVVVTRVRAQAVTAVGVALVARHEVADAADVRRAAGVLGDRDVDLRGRHRGVARVDLAVGEHRVVRVQRVERTVGVARRAWDYRRPWRTSRGCHRRSQPHRRSGCSCRPRPSSRLRSAAPSHWAGLTWPSVFEQVVMDVPVGDPVGLQVIVPRARGDGCPPAPVVRHREMVTQAPLAEVGLQRDVALDVRGHEVRVVGRRIADAIRVD